MPGGTWNDTRLPSRSTRLCRRAEGLRNLLAHGQHDLIEGSSWEELFALVEWLEEFIRVSDDLVEKQAAGAAGQGLGSLWSSAWHRLAAGCGRCDDELPRLKRDQGAQLIYVVRGTAVCSCSADAGCERHQRTPLGPESQPNRALARERGGSRNHVEPFVGRGARRGQRGPCGEGGQLRVFLYRRPQRRGTCKEAGDRCGLVPERSANGG